MRGVYALYASPEAAQRAVDGLRAAGVGDQDITIISGEPIEHHPIGARDRATWMYWIASAGGILGLLIAVWLARLTQRSWPLNTGNMPIVAWWPSLVIIFEMTMLGGILATVITMLVTAGLPRRLPALYDPAVSDGQILVGVQNPSSASAAAIERALVAGGARVKTVS